MAGQIRLAMAHRERKRPSWRVSFYLPQEVGEAIPADTRFNVELVEDGILLRPVPAGTPRLPSWLARKRKAPE